MDEEIIVWGIGAYYGMNKYLVPKSCNIIAYVNEKGNASGIKSFIENIPLISPFEVRNFSKDTAIIVFCPKERYSQYLDTGRKAGIDLSRVKHASDWFRKNNIHDTWENDQGEKQLSVIKEILVSKDDEIADSQWILNKIHEFGVHEWEHTPWYDNPGIRYTKYGVLQIPKEFAEFCQYLGGGKSE